MADSDPVEELDPTKTDEEVEVEADPENADGATDEAASTADEKPKPGTPDKHIQKLQQDLSTVTRQLAALTEKKNSGQELTDADKAKLAKAQQRFQKIQAFVARPDRNDLPSEVDDVAEEVLELTQKVSKQDQLEAQLRAANERLARLEGDHNWRVARERYQGLDVDTIWQKACKDADETLGEDGNQSAKHRLASKWFEERCEAAKKRLKDDKGKPAANNQSGRATYRAGDTASQPPTLTEEEATLAEARSLVRET